MRRCGRRDRNPPVSEEVMDEDEDLLPLSALQHYLFCERQCALIHVERTWVENSFTAEGRVFHERAHSGKAESRPTRKTEFGMPIRSLRLGLVGRTDAVEYDGEGNAFVVEYKRGRPKRGRADEVQLCAQAICIEETKGLEIREGALYYGRNRRRKLIIFDQELRDLVTDAAKKIHELVDGGKTPEAEFDEVKCTRCSLLEICLPKRHGTCRNVHKYVQRMLGGEVGE